MVHVIKRVTVATAYFGIVLGIVMVVFMLTRM